MRVRPPSLMWGGAASALLVSLLAVAPQPGMAQTRRNVKVCNSYPRTVYVAFAYQQQDGTWVSRGWRKAASGACRSATVVPSAHMYWRGETDRYEDRSTGDTVMTAWGASRKFCVSDGAFTFYRADVYCPRGRLEKFIQDITVNGTFDETVNIHKNGHSDTVVALPK